MNFFTKIIHFIMATTKLHSIDESHGIMHSLQTLHNAYSIVDNEKCNIPELKEQEKIIYVAAAIHDMCDKKYMSEDEGIQKIDELLIEDMELEEMDIVHEIIGKMSYSKVKKNGFPDMGKYQLAYNVVREADLLGAYDFDRAMVYHLYRKNNDLQEAYFESMQLFLTRMFRHEHDGLLTFDYTKERANTLKYESLKQMKNWRRIIHMK